MKNVGIVVLLLSFMGFHAGVAVAQQRQTGSTSGPAAGSSVEPSTAVEKQNPYIPQAGHEKKSGVSGTSAGAPGIEGSPDTQSGKASGAGK